MTHIGDSAHDLPTISTSFPGISKTLSLHCSYSCLTALNWSLATQDFPIIPLFICSPFKVSPSLKYYSLPPESLDKSPSNLWWANLLRNHSFLCLLWLLLKWSPPHLCLPDTNCCIRLSNAYVLVCTVHVCLCAYLCLLLDCELLGGKSSLLPAFYKYP